MHQSTPPPPSLQVTSTSFGAMQMPDRPCGAGVDPATDWGAQRKFCERRSGIHLVNLMRSFSWGQLGAGDKFRGFEGNYCEGICRQHVQEPTFFVSAKQPWLGKDNSCCLSLKVHISVVNFTSLQLHRINFYKKVKCQCYFLKAVWYSTDTTTLGSYSFQRIHWLHKLRD